MSASKVTDRLVEALRAIVAWNESGEHCDEGIPDRILNDANNALQMAQLPVVPVSEDVETIRAKLKAEVDYCVSARQSGRAEDFRNALAALDRLAAAAGRKP